MKKVIIILFLITILFPIFSENNKTDWQLYTEALEAIIQKNDELAILRFEQLISNYPESLLLSKAKDYLEILKTKIDHSGIVSFYGVQMASSLYITTMLPSLLSLTVLSPEFTIGLSGLTGIGLGLWSSWYTSHNTNLSFAHELFSEGSLAILLANYNLISNHIFRNPQFIGTKAYIAIQVGLISAQRIFSYFWIKNNPNASYGKPALALWAYAWGHFYSWLTYGAIAGLNNSIEWLSQTFREPEQKVN